MVAEASSAIGFDAWGSSCAQGFGVGVEMADGDHCSGVALGGNEEVFGRIRARVRERRDLDTVAPPGRERLST